MDENKLTLEMVARTDAGRERAINEDNFLATPNYKNPDWFLPAGAYPDAGSAMVVSDGMGGLNAGEVASKITVESIREFLSRHDKLPSSDDSVRNLLGKAILYAHKSVVTHSSKNAETAGMGSTIVVALVANNKLNVSWSGDSRCYVYRSQQLQQITKDHSYVQSLVDDGKLTNEQAFLHPESNIILQSIGDADRAPKPDYISFSLRDNDIFLICSDGVNSMLQDAEIAALMAACTSLPQCAESIVEAANNAGGVDNITALLIKVVSGAGAGTDLRGAGGDETTLDPSAGTTIPSRKKPPTGLYYSVAAVFLVLALGWFVVPMIRQKTPVVITKDSTHARDSAAGKKDSAGGGGKQPAGKAPADKAPVEKPPAEKQPGEKPPAKPEVKQQVKEAEKVMGKKPTDSLNLIIRKLKDSSGNVPSDTNNHHPAAKPQSGSSTN